MSISQAIVDRMDQQVRQWETAVDRRAIFLACYKQMTANMFIGIEKGAFQDVVWVEKLLQHFADYYFAALDAYETGSPAIPPVWRQVHDTAHHPQTHVLQNLILGVNAHINYDLVLTLVDLLDVEWPLLSSPQRELRYHDYCVVNDIIARTIDAVQDEVVEHWSPAMDVVDKMMGRLDERLMTQLITNWRQQVWTWAVRMLEAPPKRENLRAQVEMATRQRAEAVMLQHGWKSVRTLLDEI